MNGELTYREILHQPDAWDDALRAFARLETAVREAWAKLGCRAVVFTGCGSTHYLSLTAAALFRGLAGIPAVGQPASEVLFFDETIPDPAATLLIAVSRSGTTSETLAAIQRFRERGGRAVWAVTCYPDSPLAATADLALVAVGAQEQSVAQTQSFTSMLLLCQALAACVSGADWRALEHVPELGRELIAGSEPRIQAIGRILADERLFFLGAGPRFGLASEAMLKMTEMSLTTAQAFHFLEFRHGPMSMVEPGAQIIGLLSSGAAAHERAVLHNMQALGASTLVLDPTGDPGRATWWIEMPGDLPAWARSGLYMPPLQLLAYHRAMAKALDPDRPRNLSAVIHLEPGELR